MTTLAQKLAREALPCNDDRLCKQPDPMMGGIPRDKLHSYRCPARYRPAVEAVIAKAIEKAADVADKYRGDSMLGVSIYGVGPSLIANRIRSLLTNEAE